MPANEFEKQVQHIMEELKLPPSPPVWENIEEQIRKKKDRRRIIFLLLFFFLILSGGLWLMIGTGNKQMNKQNAGTEQTDPANSSTAGLSNKNQKPIIEKQNETASPKIREDANGQTHASITRIQKEQSIDQAGIKTSTKKRPAIKELKQQQSIALVSKSQDLPVEKEQEKINTVTPSQKKEKQIDVLQDQPVKTESTIIDETKQNSEAKQNADSIDNNKQTVAETKAEQKKKSTNSKWQKQVTAEIGFSNYGYGLFGNGEKSLRTSSIGMSSGPPVTPPFSNPVIAPQETTKGLAVAIGFEATRQLGKRFGFSVGLQYHYLSTHTKTGALVEKDSSINYLGDMVAISGYYKNGNESNYTNRFHAIEVPVALQYRLFRNVPLELGLGFSYGHLLKTNALSFNSQSNIYYHNKKDYVTNYLDIVSSLQYSWLEKATFSIRSGPVFSYHSTALQRSSNYGWPHLFSVGIKTSIKF